MNEKEILAAIAEGESAYGLLIEQVAWMEHRGIRATLASRLCKEKT